MEGVQALIFWARKLDHLLQDTPIPLSKVAGDLTPPVLLLTNLHLGVIFPPRSKD